MGVEPCVDAGHVEWVRAAREEADKLPVAELAEAHRAVLASPHAAAVLHGGYGSDGSIIEPHRADVPHVVHHRAPVSSLLAEPVFVRQRPSRGGSGRRAPAPTQDPATAAVEEERDEREREEEEGGEQGDGEESHGRVAIGVRRRAGEHRDGGRRGLGELVAGSASTARLALERVLLAVDGDRRVRLHRVHGYSLGSSGEGSAARIEVEARWPCARDGSGGGLVRVDMWSGLVLVGFGKSLATKEQFEVEMSAWGMGGQGLPTTATARSQGLL
jgi:hypothetical protein